MTAVVGVVAMGACGLLASPECRRRKGVMEVRGGWVAVVDGRPVLCCSGCRSRIKEFGEVTGLVQSPDSKLGTSASTTTQESGQIAWGKPADVEMV